MDDKPTRKFYLSIRSWGLITALVILLGISILWNFHQNQLIEQARQRVAAAQRAEAARAREESERLEARSKRNARWAASDARVQQLYREIDSLSRLNEQVLARPQPKPSTPSTTEMPAAKVSLK